MSSIVGEAWRPIPGIEGYEVSDHGRVRSLDRWVQRRGQSDRWYKGQILKPLPDGLGYFQVAISGRRRRRIHRLVALAFIGPCPEGMEVAHADGDGENNNIANLRYDTRKGNHFDKRKHGTHLEGEKITSAVLSNTDAATIYALKGRATGKSVAAAFKCSRATISFLWNHKTWRCINGDPSLDLQPSFDNTNTTNAAPLASSAPTTH